MIMVTTQSVEDRKILKYHGIASGEAIMGANVVRDFFASVTDVIGGRSGAYESKLAEAREIALEELSDHAKRLGANAVIGIDLDFETIKEGMIMCIATGTAVTLD